MSQDSVLSRFNPMAMGRPETPADILALLREAIQEIENINEIIDSWEANAAGLS